MADYALLDSEKGALFTTHGHLFNEELLPPLKSGDVLFNGHFHVPCHRELANGVLYANCGSVALPKDGTPHSYILVDGNKLLWKNLVSGETFDEVTL